MKKCHLFIAVFLVVIFAAYHTYFETYTIQIKQSFFRKSHVETKDNYIISKGEVAVHDSYGALLSVDVNEDMTATFRIIYSKEKGELKIDRDWRNLEIPLQKAAVSNADAGNVEVELEKGTNVFIISGNDCVCEYAATLIVPDASKIADFDGGFIMPHE